MLTQLVQFFWFYIRNVNLWSHHTPKDGYTVIIVMVNNNAQVICDNEGVLLKAQKLAKKISHTTTSLIN